jgi:hypothetical protein
MLNKTSHLKFIVIILFALSIIACNASGGDSAEVEALQQQVDALATQNAILLEDKQDSANGNDTAEVDAPAPPSDDQDTQTEIVNPTPETLPDKPVPAGTTIFYEGWALTMSNDIRVSGDNIYLTFTIRNTGDNSRVFRLIKSGVKLFDDQGNEYPMRSWGSCPDHFNITHQFSLGGGDSTKLYSLDYSRCSSSTRLSTFEGRISPAASYLVINVDEWGPFNGVVFHLDL